MQCRDQKSITVLVWPKLTSNFFSAIYMNMGLVFVLWAKKVDNSTNRGWNIKVAMFDSIC